MSISTPSNGLNSYFSNFNQRFNFQLPKISWGTTKEMFSSSFSSTSQSKIENATDITTNVKHAKLKTGAQNDQRTLIFTKEKHSFAFKCFAIMAGLGLTFYGVRSRMGAHEDQFFFPTNNSSEPSSLQGRHLLALPSMDLGNLELIEETQFSENWITSDVFGTTKGGALIISATQLNNDTLPPQISISNSLSQVVSALSIQGIGVITRVNDYILAGSPAAFSRALQIISLKDITNPFVVSVVPTPSNVVAIACTVNLLCYALSSVALQVIDVSNLPYATTLKIDSSIQGTNIAISNQVGVVFNANTLSNIPNLFILDLKDPLNPRIVASIFIKQTSTIGVPDFQVSDIDVDGYNCCIANGFGSVQIVDLHNISNPIIRGTGQVENVMQMNSVNGFDVLAKGNFCILNANNNGIQTFNITNPMNVTLTSIAAPGNSFLSMKEYNNYLYVGSNNQLTELDMSDFRNPVTVSISNFPVKPFLGGQIEVSDRNVFFADSNSGYFRATTRGQTFTLEGTPAGRTAGNYTIRLVAKDVNGTSINRDVVLNLIVQPAVMINGAVSSQIAVVGNTVSFFIPPFTFKQLNGNGLTYTATLSDGRPLPGWLNFNALSAAFAGTPSIKDVANLSIRVTATDSLDASNSIEFPINILYGPTVNYQISNQVVQQGTSFNYKIPSDLIIDKDGESFQISVTNNGQLGVPFPTWLSYNTTTNTFSGTPKTSADLGNTIVSVKATATSGASVTTTFQIQAVLPGTPLLKAPVSNVVAAPNAPVVINIQSIFESPLGEDLQYTVSGYPGWMSYHPITGILSGTPTRFDVGTDTNDVETVIVTAKGEVANNSYSFTVTVQGTPTLLFANQIANAVLAIFAAISGVYAFRVRLWNKCCKARYIKENKIAHVGDILQHHIKAISANNVKRPFALIKRKPRELFTLCGHTVHLPKMFTPNRETLPGGLYLPKWLHYHHLGNLLISESIPKEEAGLTYKIFVVDTTGYIRERFNLIIKTTLNNLIANEEGDDYQDVPPTIKNYVRDLLKMNKSSESQPLLKEEQKEQKLTPPSSSNSDDKFRVTTGRRHVRSSSPVRSEAETELVSIRTDI